LEQGPLPASKTPTAAKNWAPPRTPDGKPDLQGIWNNATLTPLERPKGLGTKEFYTEQEYAELMKRVLKGDVGPEGVVPPTLPEATKRNADLAAKNKGHEFDSHENRPLQERWILMGQERLPMVPGVNDNNLLQITQGPGWVAMLHEINHHTRVIPTDGRPHISQNIRQWQGDSVGRWEGNTLVVDTTNFSGVAANYRGSSEKLHLIERFTRVSDDTILYEFTVEDPTTWAKPWTAEISMTKTQGPVYEWSCHEGNSMISNILQGARVEEEAARKTAK
jgi:hypothetical protein